MDKIVEEIGGSVLYLCMGTGIIAIFIHVLTILSGY